MCPTHNFPTFFPLLMIYILGKQSPEEIEEPSASKHVVIHPAPLLIFLKIELFY